MPARPPALSVHLLGHDRPGEPALARVRLRLRPERPRPERQARAPPRTGRCSARAPAPAPMATFPNATRTINASTTIANKGKGRNGACGARRDIHGESVIINLWAPTPLFFFSGDELTAEIVPNIFPVFMPSTSFYRNRWTIGTTIRHRGHTCPGSRVTQYGGVEVVARSGKYSTQHDSEEPAVPLPSQLLVLSTDAKHHIAPPTRTLLPPPDSDFRNADPPLAAPAAPTTPGRRRGRGCGRRRGRPLTTAALTCVTYF